MGNATEVTEPEAGRLVRRVREAIAFHAVDLGLDLTDSQRREVEADVLVVLRQGPIPVRMGR